MKNFVLTAFDYTDEQALDRRMAVRQDHIKFIDELRDQRKALLGAAILDDSGKMIGSTIFFQMTQGELDEYMKTEPYITQNVWEKIEIKECKIGPSFIEALVGK